MDLSIAATTAFTRSCFEWKEEMLKEAAVAHPNHCDEFPDKNTQGQVRRTQAMVFPFGNA